MPKYMMALDSGTTSNRCILFDRAGRIVSVAQREFTQYFPQPGWVEHDANEIWATLLGVAVEAMQMAGAAAADIAAIGITNQRETTIVWDKATGEPVHHAIVWQCRRTSEYCDELRARGLTARFREKTGLVLDAYFSATKLHWLLENVPGVRERAAKGELLFGTVETWLIWKLTGGRAHVTDYSNASRTMLFNINTLDWDEEILAELNIPRSMLPKPLPSSGLFGTTDTSLLGGEIPITGAAGDQQAALFGQTCFQPGAAIQWLRDEMKLIANAAESEAVAQEVADTNGCYVVPAFTGLGAPYWDQYARGAIVGLTRGCNRAHIVRATLDSLTYQTYDVLNAMRADSGIALASLKVDGGASANNYLMQTQADVIGAPVLRPTCVESTAMGAAYLAGLAVGFWRDQAEIRKIWAVDRTFEPQLDAKSRDARLHGWHRAVQRAFDWAKEE